MPEPANQTTLAGTVAPTAGKSNRTREEKWPGEWKKGDCSPPFENGPCRPVSRRAG